MGGDGGEKSGGSVGGRGGGGGDGGRSNHRDTLSNVGASEPHCAELLSHLPGVGAGELGRTQVTCFPLCPPQASWVQGRGEERGLGQTTCTARLCHIARDAVLLPFPRNGAMEHGSHSPPCKAQDARGHGGHWASCQRSGFSATCPYLHPGSPSRNRAQAKQCTVPFPYEDLTPGLPAGRRVLASASPAPWAVTHLPPSLQAPVPGIG